MILSDVEIMARQDLFDQSSQRWATSDIDRAIDKAVDRYTAYYPNVIWTDMAVEAWQRTYPYPAPYNSAYPVLWIERVLYPLQVYGSYFSPPSVAPTLTKVSGSGLGVGNYQYAVTFLSQGGETTPSPIGSVSTTSGNQQVSVTNIPLGPATTAQPSIATNTVIGRNLYRSMAGGSTLYLLATLQDNTATGYTDSAADSVLVGKPQPPVVNSSGVMVYPPRERDFSEYSNLYDSTASLAAGGNNGAMGAVGTAQSPLGSIAPTFTLNLAGGELPQDNTMLMRVFYATKHQLDSNGSTIPEIHRDIIVLGATAYAMEAYQVPTNDNFSFEDGSLRDRLDDTRIPQAWLASAQSKMKQFKAALEEIKRQRDFASSSRAHWGQIGWRYNWL